jgi:hypothetical protein
MIVLIMLAWMSFLVLASLSAMCLCAAVFAGRFEDEVGFSGVLFGGLAWALWEWVL